MTHEQAVSETHYRLCKFLLQNLREAGIITAGEESQCRSRLIQEIQPFTQCGRTFESPNPKRKFCGRACYAESRRKRG